MRRSIWIQWAVEALEAVMAAGAAAAFDAPAITGAAASNATRRSHAARAARQPPPPVECAATMADNDSTGTTSLALSGRAGSDPHIPAPLIDIGINLAHDSYDADRTAVIERAAAAGVAQ